MEMKKTLIIPILLLIFSCSSPKAVLKTNRIEEIGTLVDSLKEGKWKTYDNGKLISVGNYSKNLKNGYWRFFYSNGKKHQQGKFLKDWQVGSWIYYFESGQFMGKGIFIDNQQNGLWKWFHKNGKLYTERLYDHGKLLAIESCFDKNGKLLDCGRIKDGNGTVIFHDLENDSDKIERFEFVKGILKEK